MQMPPPVNLGCDRLQGAAMSPAAEAAAVGASLLEAAVRRERRRAQARLMRIQHSVEKWCTEILYSALYPSLQFCSALTNCRIWL